MMAPGSPFSGIAGWLRRAMRRVSATLSRTESGRLHASKRRKNGPPMKITWKIACSQICATTAALFLFGCLAFAQGVGGYAPGVNPGNPNDMTLRANPNNMTLPGAANPHDLVRSRPASKAASARRNLATVSPPPVSSSLAHTYTTEPAKKAARRKHRAAGLKSQ